MSAVYMQVLKVGEVRSGIKDGRPWKMQEAQVMLLDQAGEIVEVGVYDLRRDEIETMTVGLYMPRYSLGTGRADKNKGKVVASVVGWTPMAKDAKGNLVQAGAVASEALSKAKA